MQRHRILPTRPNVLLFAILGACLGMVFSVTWTLFRGLWEGVSVSEANLELANQQLAGKLPLVRHASKFNLGKYRPASYS